MDCVHKIDMPFNLGKIRLEVICMYRPQCSYWITVSRPDSTVSGPDSAVEAASKAVMENPAFEGCFQMEVDEYGDCHFELKNSTTEEMSEFYDTLAGIAASNPEVNIRGEEIDEESHNYHRLFFFKEGKIEDVKHGRTLAPEDYDAITVSHCVQLLNEAGFSDAAKLLEEKAII